MAELNTATESGSKHLTIEDQFHIWFEKNRKIVVVTCCAVILVALGFIFWFWNRSTTETNAATALAKAKSVSEYEQVVTRYPETRAARGALLLAADGYFSVGNYKDAQAAYERFLRNYPNSELADSAQFGIASCLEAQGDYTRATAAYEALRSNYHDSIHEGDSQLALARCAEAQGDLQKARQLLDNLIASSPPASPWAREAASKVEILGRKFKPTAPTQPQIPSLVLPSPSGPAPPPGK
jgi:tetratricopeptide (TPR) repeat protein